MFDNLKNLAGLMGQAREFKVKMEQVQKDLEKKIVEADAGAGAVRVTMNGKFEVLDVHLDRPMLIALAGEGDTADLDAQMVQDLIAAAFNAALEKAREVAEESLAEVTGGLDMGGLGKMLGN